jgi:phage shock protein C
MADKKLYRSESDRMLAGVCGGIAEVYDFDPTLVRLVTIVLIFSGLSPLLYLLAWIIIPAESEIKE